MAVSLAIIIILGLGADYLFRRLKLPGLVGMLLVGMLVGPHVLGLLRPGHPQPHRPARHYDVQHPCPL
jgi:Kef-type K+ transport system membrane component KefB